VGASGLPNLDDFRTEETSTKQTDTSHRAPPSVRRRVHPTITVLTGVDAGLVVAAEEVVTLGRGAECTLVLSDPGVSRAHARIHEYDGGAGITDLGSKNGTFVDGNRAQTTLVLPSTCVIQVGPNVALRYAPMTVPEEKLARDLYESSMRDALTQVFNRRYFMNRLKAEVAFAARHQAYLSVVLIDLDHFKRLNDTRGHAAGDEVLREVARRIVATLRTEDVCARIGGEEFVLLLRGIGLDNAKTCAQRVRSAVAGASVAHEGEGINVTISLGVASTQEPAINTPARLLAAADKRLYRAKREGRNRVCSS
jgi:diguanylate cyclase (GGDEF)-like protein